MHNTVKVKQNCRKKSAIKIIRPSVKRYARTKADSPALPKEYGHCLLNCVDYKYDK